MKKHILAACMLCMALPALQAQVDTSRLGDSWMLFPPKHSKLISYKYLGEYIRAPFDTLYCNPDPTHYQNTSIPPDTISEMPDVFDSVLMDHMASFPVLAFRYSDSVDRVVYGISVTLNVYKTMPWTKELYCHNVERTIPAYFEPIISKAGYGVGDSGYYPFFGDTHRNTIRSSL